MGTFLPLTPILCHNVHFGIDQAVVLLLGTFSKRKALLMSQFDWQSDDDWPRYPVASPKRYPRWLLWLFPVGLLGGILLIGSWWLNQQVDEHIINTTDTLQNEVLTTHRLVQQTAVTGDAELFATLLSTWQPDWPDTQVQLANNHLYLNRAPLGLTLLSDHPPTFAPHIWLSPDLREAELTERLPYTLAVQGGISATVWLSQTAVYRRHPLTDAWLLASHDNDVTYWGTRQEIAAPHITVSYPARDADMAQRLTRDLDEWLDQLCRQALLPCTTDSPLPHLLLRLEPTTASLLHLAAYPTLNLRTGQSRGLTLPTPTLVGRPIDEGGYRAIAHGYAAWVVTAVLSQAQQFTSPEILARQLARLGLSTPQVAGLIRSPMVVGHAAPPPPWPGEDVQMMCEAYAPLALWRYQPESDTWRDELAGQSGLQFPYVLAGSDTQWLPLTDDSGLLVTIYQAVAGVPHWRTFLWRDGQERLLLDETTFYALWPTFIQEMLDPSGQHLGGYRQISQTGDSFSRIYNWFAWAGCGDALCPWHSLDGLPIWSPGGAHLLIERVDTLVVAQADGQPIAAPVAGRRPFWVDNASFGYTRIFTDGFDLVTAVLPAAHTPISPTIMVTSATLSAALPGPLPLKAWHLNQVLSPTTGAAKPDGRWYFSVRQGDGEEGGQVVVLAWDPTRPVQTAVTQLFATTTSNQMASLAHPGNGRYLALTTTDGLSLVLTVYDLMSDQKTIYHTPYWSQTLNYDWSADGEWLAILEDGRLRLINPAAQYEWPIFHNLSGCYMAAWRKRP